jgi:hypothetical protein
MTACGEETAQEEEQTTTVETEETATEETTQSTETVDEYVELAGEYQDEYSQRFVFTVQERHGTLVDVSGNFLHQCVTGFRPHDGAAQHGSNQKREDTGANG